MGQKTSLNTNRPRTRWIGIFLLVLVLGGTGHIVADDEQTGSTTPSLAHIGTVEAVSEDLVVAVTWADSVDLPATATLRASDGNGTVRASQTVVPLPGQTSTVRLIRTLADTAQHGFQFHLSVVSPVDTALAAERPVRVAYVCADELCVYRTITGLRAGEVMIDRRLAKALDQQEAADSLDLLGDALTADASLTGAVVTLASQLDSVAAAAKNGDGCFCFWESSATLSPETMSWVHHHAAGWEEVAWFGPGAALGLGYQKRAAHPSGEQDHDGSSEVAMALRCWEIDAWLPVGLGFLHDGDEVTPLVVSQPRARACHRDCPAATVDLDARAIGRTAVGVLGNGRAEAETRVDLAFTDPTGKSVTRIIDLHLEESDITLPDRTAVRIQDACAANPDLCSHTVSGRDAAIRLTSDATIEVPAVPLSSDSVWSLAIARLDDYAIRAVGSATCTTEPVVSIERVGGIPPESPEYCDGGGALPDSCGLVIDPWG
ncbi:MAG: hypothetical protein AAGD38_08510 [Acidobacteriota bacterium]